MADTSTSTSVDTTMDPKDAKRVAACTVPEGEGPEFVDCTVCKLCAETCPAELSLDYIMPRLRYLTTPRGAHRGMFQTLMKMLTFADMNEWMVDVETDPDNEALAFFPGCAPIFDVLLERDSNYSGASHAAVKVLNKLGIKPKLLYGCCGHDLYYAGQLDDYSQVKERLAKRLEAYPGTIIVGCAECYHMLKNHYGANVKPFADFVLERWDELGIEKEQGQLAGVTFTYHDPCRYGRHNDLYDAPREILNRIAAFNEMENVRENATCCSVSSWLNCNKEAKKIREDRMREGNRTGADYLAVGCEKCRMHFDCIYCEENYDGTDEEAVPQMKMLDLQEIVGWAAGVYDPFSGTKSYAIRPAEGMPLPSLISEPEHDPNRYIDDELLKNAFSCTTCARCTEVCPVSHPTKARLEAFRAELVKLGKGPDKHLGIMENLKATGNVFKDDKIVAKDDPEADVIYFPGCVAKYRMGKLVDSTTAILDALGVRYAIPSEIVCCGSVAFRTGHDPTFLVEKNTEIFKGKKVVVSCAGCYSTFKHDYEGIDVYHIAEFVAERLKELKLNDIPVKVTYHDPCHLGRGSGIYDEPRALIEAIPGVEFIEYEDTRENAICCGGGGGVRSHMPDLANNLATNRGDAAKALGVELILSSCPFCEISLMQNCDLKVMDVTELLLKSMKGEAL